MEYLDYIPIGHEDAEQLPTVPNAVPAMQNFHAALSGWQSNPASAGFPHSSDLSGPPVPAFHMTEVPSTP